MLKKFVRDADGASAVEYGLIVAVLSLLILGGFSNAMRQMLANFEYATEVIEEARN